MMDDTTPSVAASTAELHREMDRQDRVHPDGYPATRDGVFLGIQTAVHELQVEAVEAWRPARCKCETPRCGHADWGGDARVMAEAGLQALAEAGYQVVARG